MSDPETLRDVGEFGLISRIAALIGASAEVIGIGDDAAVLDIGGDELLLATVDMQVEGVHFLLSDDPVKVGTRSLAVNLSDIAAMGGTPLYALVSLAAAPELEVRYVEEFYRGLVTEADRVKVSIVGGNVTRTSGPLCIDVTVLGRVARGQVVLRNGARPGDALLVSGELGGHAARRLAGESSAPPRPRIELGRALAESGLAHAMLDLSDGLGGDVHHMADRSGVGAVLHEALLPIATDAKQLAAQTGRSPVELALFGGEDYELLVAVAPESIDAAIAAASDTPLTKVGEVVAADEGITLQPTVGPRRRLPLGGWEHF